MYPENKKHYEFTSNGNQMFSDQKHDDSIFENLVLKNLKNYREMKMPNVIMREKRLYQIENDLYDLIRYTVIAKNDWFEDKRDELLQYIGEIRKFYEYNQLWLDFSILNDLHQMLLTNKFYLPINKYKLRDTIQRKSKDTLVLDQYSSSSTIAIINKDEGSLWRRITKTLPELTALIRARSLNSIKDYDTNMHSRVPEELKQIDAIKLVEKCNEAEQKILEMCEGFYKRKAENKEDLNSEESAIMNMVKINDVAADPSKLLLK